MHGKLAERPLLGARAEMIGVGETGRQGSAAGRERRRGKPRWWLSTAHNGACLLVINYCWSANYACLLFYSGIRGVTA